jgi:hypothetical protein
VGMLIVGVLVGHRRCPGGAPCRRSYATGNDGGIC